MYPKHDEDFYGWAMSEASLLRQHKWSELDIEHLAEELESMGASEKRELISRLAQLLMHLLKWHFQPALRAKSWEITLREQRRAAGRLIKENPSFKAKINDCTRDAYEDAIDMAIKETGLDEKAFPTECPYTFEQMMDDGFYPE
jgi:hypothetical protein